MRPRDLATFLSAAIRNRLAILITGAPGIGKSDIVAQAAADAGADLLLSHPAVADPTDAKGLPWPVAGADEATFLPFGELARAVKATRPTVWFLDDLGQAPPAVQASYMQLLLARRVNGHALPDFVSFVAATNRRTDRAGVAGILEPVKSRFASIVELVPHVDDWSEWALDHDVPTDLVAFIRFRPDLLCNFQASADLTNSPIPRTWSHVARLSAAGLPAEVEYDAFSGAVGAGAATEFVAFRRLIRDMPNLDAILLDPTKGDLPEAPAILYATVTGLAARSTPATFPRIAAYAERLTGAHHGEFAALLLRDCVRRDKAICNTAAFVNLVSGPLGALITGQ